MKYFILFLFTYVCLAQTPRVSFVNFSRFTQNGESMPQGKFLSQFIENKEKRTPIILTAGEKMILGLESDALYIANFKHEGKHFIAKVQGVKVEGENKVISAQSRTKSMKIVKEKWAAKKRPELQELEAHASMLIEFKKGNGIELVKLQENTSFIDLKENRYVDKVIVSFEAFRGQRSLSNPLLPDGFFDNFAGGIRVYSEQENVRRKIGKNINSYEDSIYYLNLENLKSNSFKKQKNLDPGLAFILNSIYQSDSLGREATYNALTKNCFSELTKLIDSTFPDLKIDKANHAQSLIETASLQSKVILNFLDELTNNKIDDILDKYGIKLNAQEQKELLSIKEDLVEQLDNAIDNNKLVRNSIKKKVSNSQEKTLKKYLSGVPIFFENNIKARNILSHVTRMTYCVKHFTAK